MTDITVGVKAQGLSIPLKSEEQQAITGPLSYSTVTGRQQHCTLGDMQYVR